MLYWSNSKKVHTLPIDVYSGGPIPHNMAKTFDGPPTLERSGSEHRVGRLHPSFLRREGLVRMWSSPCRRDGEVEKSLYQQGRTG